MSEASKRKALKMEILCNKVESVVGKTLQDHYPGYLWNIECRPDYDIVEVKNISLHGDYGFVLYLSRIIHDLELLSVIRAGGELLERCGLPARRRPEDMESLITRDVKGNVKELDTHGAS